MTNHEKSGDKAHPSAGNGNDTGDKRTDPHQGSRRRRRKRGSGNGAGRAGKRGDARRGESRRSESRRGDSRRSSGRNTGHGSARPNRSNPRNSRTPKDARNTRPTRPRHSSNDHHMPTRDETSAGGLVVSGLAEAVAAVPNPGPDDVDMSQIYVALIGRLDRRGRLLWSMPKGHVEDGEDKSATAEREVWEETGVHGQVFAELGTIDYWFVSDGVRIHKTVHHHLLRFVDGVLNDEDPEVTEVSWIPVSTLIEHLAYADERKLARTAHDILPELAVKEAAAGRTTPR
ncbi:NUDIX hydrolase [Corynebacterium massiliense]|uniref:NUDIX hydrolase n=1 Tax=Corynebacterium massiliense TaxID=441501 RepID=UPI0023521261|nr:NUDIX hydrolase [Corynebacterium massiliense]